MGIFSRKPPDIARMKEQENIDGLIKALRYKKDPRVRVDAAKALGTMTYDKSIIMALVGAMDEENSEVRERIVFALGQLGEHLNIKMLVDKLKHPDSITEVNMFVGVLDKIYPIEAIRMLADILINGNETSGVRKMAGKALKKLGIAPSLDILSNINAKK